MSHSSSKRKVLDIEAPLAHRASHARSCANHVANRLGITRSELLMKVESDTGASLISPLTEDELFIIWKTFKSDSYERKTVL